MDDLFADLGLDVEFMESQKKEIKLSDENLYGRVIYLIDVLEVKLPSWLKGKLPYSKELDNSKSLWSPLITSAYKKGKAYGKGNAKELKQVLDALLYSEMENLEERTNFNQYLGSLTQGLFSTNVEKPMREVEGEEIPKFYSGFKAIDNCFHGFYQGVFCLAGEPGSGKSTIVICLAAELAKQFPVWYFQTEIPSGLVQARIKQLGPETWHNDSYFHAGNYSSATILEMVKRNPNPDRIVVYDSPEIKDSSMDNLAYFEKTYQELVQIKMLSKAVFVTSQIKQGVSWDDLGVYSLNDSASKARYADGIIYLKKFNDNLLVKSAKNRFGNLGNAIVQFDYKTMKATASDIDDLFFIDFEEEED